MNRLKKRYLVKQILSVNILVVIMLMGSAIEVMMVSLKAWLLNEVVLGAWLYVNIRLLERGKNG